MVVETNWPVVCDTTDTPLSEPTIPADIEGQIIWTEVIFAVLNSVNLNYGDKALGIVYWEPGWMGNAALGSACAVRSFPFLGRPVLLTDFIFGF
jgi:arabinogalactan endo-1,4-beta-galactosidase